MFSKKPKDKQAIDHAIDATFNAYNPNDPDAVRHLKLLKGLHGIKAQTEPKRPNPDTMLMVAGNIVGVILIVGHERAHVVTSKALQFIKQTR